MIPAKSTVVIHYATPSRDRAPSQDDALEPGSPPPAPGALAARGRAAGVAPPVLELVPPGPALPVPPPLRAQPPGVIAPPADPGPPARWRERASAAALVVSVGFQNAVLQGAGQAAALTVVNRVVSPLVMRLARPQATATDVGLAVASAVATWALSAAARGMGRERMDRRDLARASLHVLGPMSLPLAGLALGAPYRQIGVALSAGQALRFVSVMAAMLTHSILGSAAARIQVLQPPTGPAPERSLAASLDRDRQAMMACVHVALAIAAAWMLLRPPSALDAVVDAAGAASYASADPRPRDLPLWMALVTAVQAFMETATGALAASRNGLVLAPRGPSGLGRTQVVEAHAVPFIAGIDARSAAGSLALDWVPAILRTVREALGIPAGSPLVQPIFAGLGWLAQGLSRSSDVQVQRQVLREMHLHDPRPDAPMVLADLGVIDAEPGVIPAEEQPLEQLLDRYDVYLGTTGNGLQFAYRRGEGDA